jgi:hypothetical protein
MNELDELDEKPTAKTNPPKRTKEVIITGKAVALSPPRTSLTAIDRNPIAFSPSIKSSLSPSPIRKPSLSAAGLSPPKLTELKSSLKDDQLVEKIMNFNLQPSLLDTKLHSYGPYIRVYDRGEIVESERPSKVQFKKPRQVTASLPSKEKYQVKYTSIIDVSSHREKLYSSTSYPTVIKVPASIKRVVVGTTSPTGSSYMREGSGSPSVISLNRPRSSKAGPRYVRSNTTASNHNGIYTLNPNLDPAQPLLPFLHMTNALQLHLQLKVLGDNERIVVWDPGSYLVQSYPFIPQPPQRPYFFTLFQSPKPEINHTLRKSQHFPGYLLLTNKFVYILKPLIRLNKLKSPLYDEQTSYMNPAKLLEIAHKIDLLQISRIDVGPGRQYLCFHTERNKTLESILFQTRSKQYTTIIVDLITTVVHEENNDIGIINQDIEWFTKYTQENILLKPGRKHTELLNYRNVWNAQDYSLDPKEFDTGTKEEITKVDFDFVKFFLHGCFLRYLRPVPETDCRGVEIQGVAFLGTREYIYIMQERLDVWPPAIFPPEYKIQNDGYKYVGEDLKGFLVDIVAPFDLLGVGRITDITRIEKWRSWRIDEGSEQFKGLGASLQNGHLGYLNQTLSARNQQGSAGGWFWWARVCFGDTSEREMPARVTTDIPQGYFWDLAFASRESIDDFIKVLTMNRPLIRVIVGDD